MPEGALTSFILFDAYCSLVAHAQHYTLQIRSRIEYLIQYDNIIYLL